MVVAANHPRLPTLLKGLPRTPLLKVRLSVACWSSWCASRDHCLEPSLGLFSAPKPYKLTEGISSAGPQFILGPELNEIRASVPGPVGALQTDLVEATHEVSER